MTSFYLGGCVRDWESFVVNSGYKYVGETDSDLIFEYNGFDFKCNKYNFPPKKISIRQCLTPRDYCVSKFNIVHNNYYTYDNFEWVGKVSDYGVFTCPTHGDFEQVANYHLTGNGCQVCGLQKTGFTKTAYMKACAGGSSVYILKLKKDDECFYKIGISKNIKNRINGIVCESGYLVECVYSEFFKDSSVTFDVEKILHNKFREFKYKPEINFSGSSECFNMNDHSFVVEFLKGVVL